MTGIYLIKLITSENNELKNFMLTICISLFIETCGKETITHFFTPSGTIYRLG